MEFSKSLSERQIVIITTRPEPGAAVDWEAEFKAASKAPAGEVSGKPEFRLYLGVNSGSYAIAPNGSLIFPPVPIEWIVALFNVTDGQCHTASKNLTLFGAINLLVIAIILFTGCRPFIRFFIRGLFGQPGKYSVFWTWIFVFGL
ncbi:hypothetical protein MAPG_10714 [Magnaporthiopsis poae ATCC 64411]|uniref:Uncharacterized protein n=1 Tax=Magnaporthiopsis poae (strain ATCC 64411 / 73-15) TaxID=644358 RepID=A0A0C4EDB9_MAGP6|nr:hypothetical protein MAPG_10714 [Magnaporthiopsis poae ATCC 64411]